MTEQPRAMIRIEISIPERLESLLTSFLDRGIPALVRLADALEHQNAINGPQTAINPPVNAVPGAELERVIAVSTPATCSPAPGAPVLKWTPERVALLEKRWRAAVDMLTKLALLREINAMAGEPIKDVPAMMAKVYSMGWHKVAPAASPPSKSTAPAIVHLQAPSAPAAPLRAVARRESTQAAPRLETSPTAWQPLPAAESPAPLPAPTGDEAKRQAERMAKLKTMWEAGDDIDIIVVALNRMPGPIITAPEITRKAAARGYMRPAPTDPECFTKGGPATLEEIKAWFTDAGGDPDKIPTTERLFIAANTLRRVMKQPAFELIEK